MISGRFFFFGALLDEEENIHSAHPLNVVNSTHMEPSKTFISRDLAAQYGKEAVGIIEVGEYRAPSGRTVRIADLLERAVQATTSYPPESAISETATGDNQTVIEVENETTLAAAQRLLQSGHNPVALNFASATHPGGGFLSGARAQEEYLARSSGLYACLKNNPMYEFHRSNYDPLYSNYAIYSPRVPVFRSDDGLLLEEPYCVAIITSPAVNASQLDPARRSEIKSAMWRRILKVLSIGVLQEHDSIVLGAWGCGAFGNDSSEMARLFRMRWKRILNGLIGGFSLPFWTGHPRGDLLFLFSLSSKCADCSVIPHPTVENCSLPQFLHSLLQRSIQRKKATVKSFNDAYFAKLQRGIKILHRSNPVTVRFLRESTPSCLSLRLSALFRRSLQCAFCDPLRCFFTRGRWPRMARLIDSELSAAGQHHPREQAPALVLHWAADNVMAL